MFAVLQAEALAISGQKKQIDSYVRAVAQAIQHGGESATIAYASAFAQAVAGKAHHVHLEYVLDAHELDMAFPCAKSGSIVTKV
jgi:hypothetical protein